MSTITRLDACPECPPGIPDAAPAVGEPVHFAGGTLTDHGPCGLCGSAWTAVWRDGWVIGRLLAETYGEPATRKDEAA